MLVCLCLYILYSAGIKPQQLPKSESLEIHLCLFKLLTEYKDGHVTHLFASNCSES